tara:strand:+ start:744 stop:983 length:240 start_codon:yes stop_codon:yes gene_type:complete
MSHPGNDRVYADALDQAVEEALKRRLSDIEFDNFVKQRADQIVGELPDLPPHDYEERMCPCGTSIEECADVYEHTTQGV